MTSRKQTNGSIEVIDAETDPFLHARVPAPFVFGHTDGNVFHHWWGKDCVVQLVAFLRTRPVGTIVYAHNGGKFDFMYLLDYLENPIVVINGRIAKARIGPVEIRDSWCILPFALEQFDKGKIDYAKFEVENRDRHRRKILRYLERDCRSLWALVAAYLGRFGSKLTVGSTAIGELGKKHEILRHGPSHDKRFRRFYFGGRVQCFETGHLHGKFTLIDRNSMYPAVMAERYHPHGTAYSEFGHKDAVRFVVGKGYPWFGIVSAAGRGAFPIRDERTGKLEFPSEGTRRTFFTTGHEFEEARRLGLLDPSFRIEKAFQCEGRVKFDRFVRELYAERYEHRAAGRRALELGAKYVLNSAYGKFAQNPANFEEFYVRRPSDDCPGDPGAPDNHWRLHTDYGPDRGEIWARPVPQDGHGFFDVATAASITGAARAVLMRALHSARRPIYCDTDSIIAEAPGMGLEMGEGLGAWKVEARAREAFILARKLYSLWNGRRLVKDSAKGIQKSQLTKSDWERLIQGAELEISNPAPCMKISGEVTFTRRKIRYVPT